MTFCAYLEGPPTGEAAPRMEERPRVRRAPACKPDSVLRAACRELTKRDRHLSGAAVADGLERPTRVLGRAPFVFRHGRCVALHPVGFAQPRESPRALVGSYPTVSPITCVP